jgi:uncharacterized membrane protein YdfJ with MMPL/SSD domain
MSKGQKNSRPVTVRIAVWSARHKWFVAPGWFIFTIGLFLVGAVGMGTRTEDIANSGSLSKLEASKGWEVFNADGAPEPTDTVVFLLTHPTLKVTDEAYRNSISRVATDLRNLQYDADGTPAPVFSSVRDKVSTPLDFGLLSSSDGTTARIVGTITGNAQERSRKVNRATPQLLEIQKAARAADTNLGIYIANGAILNKQVNEVIQHDMDNTLKITLPATFLILLIAFGAVVASLVPLVLGVTALAGTFGAMAIYSHVFGAIDPNVSQLVVLIGLAVGVDYSLFLITRYRTERRHGRDKLEAIEIASSTAGRAVFFSGVTVMISLGGLFLLGETLFNSMAVGCILVVGVAVLGSLTFLPAVLAILGNGINWLRLPFLGRDKDEGSGFWAKLVHNVMRRPVTFTVAIVALLLVVTFPLFHIRLGNNSIDGLPDSIEGIRTLKIMNQKWPQGLNLTLSVYVTDADKPETRQAIERFKTAAGQIPGLTVSPDPLSVSKGGKVAIQRFLMAGTRNDVKNQEIVKQLRSQTVPQFFPNTRVYVGGGAASTLDTVNYFAGSIPLVMGFVLTLSFALLLVAFRSLVIPIKAILLNLLSLGAAFGVMVWVFQDGYFSDVIGFVPTGVIESFVPLFMFTILFGLSMDYHLFILTRVKEAKDRGLSSNEAVAKGISVTSGTITSAAAIMIVVFAVFVTLQIMIVRQLGLGLAVAVLVDATIIRCILLPASMRLLGEWNWWLPGFLNWLPHVNIEGEPEAPVLPTPEPEVELVSNR